MAIARLTGSVLLTRDQEIIRSGCVKTLWYGYPSADALFRPVVLK